MQRTFNYTNRKKIDKKQALFSFKERDGQSPEFDVVFNINADDYPANTSLYVEAYYKETRQRFDCGKFPNIRKPANRVLDQIDLSGPTLFRVLVVDESGRHGQLLASGSQFRADVDSDSQDRTSILPVRKHPLEQQTWRVHFESGAAPELHLNSKIYRVIELMRTDPTFQALVLPAVLREILTHYVWNDDDPDDEYCGRWMAFASLFAEQKPASEDPMELTDWVNEVVDGFSTRFHLADRLINASEGEEP